MQLKFVCKKKELDNWRRCNVYNEVPDQGQQCVSVRLVQVGNYRKRWENMLVFILVNKEIAQLQFIGKIASVIFS